MAAGMLKVSLVLSGLSTAVDGLGVTPLQWPRTQPHPAPV
jgi:hypothetical protein